MNPPRRSPETKDFQPGKDTERLDRKSMFFVRALEACALEQGFRDDADGKFNLEERQELEEQTEQWGFAAKACFAQATGFREYWYRPGNATEDGELIPGDFIFTTEDEDKIRGFSNRFTKFKFKYVYGKRQQAIERTIDDWKIGKSKPAFEDENNLMDILSSTAPADTPSRLVRLIGEYEDDLNDSVREALTRYMGRTITEPLTAVSSVEKDTETTHNAWIFAKLLRGAQVGISLRNSARHKPKDVGSNGRSQAGSQDKQEYVFSGDPEKDLRRVLVNKDNIQLVETFIDTCVLKAGELFDDGKKHGLIPSRMKGPSKENPEDFVRRYMNRYSKEGKGKDLQYERDEHIKKLDQFIANATLSS